MIPAPSSSLSSTLKGSRICLGLEKGADERSAGDGGRGSLWRARPAGAREEPLQASGSRAPFKLLREHTSTPSTRCHVQYIATCKHTAPSLREP
eukprot:803376-Rhodomonas_salina.1